MKVFKFGGASVKNAEGVKNILKVLSYYTNDKLLIIISAMGKTTNGLEEVVKSYFKNDGLAIFNLQKIESFHFDLIENLFTTGKEFILDEIKELFEELKSKLAIACSENYDFEYDQIVSCGEILSTKIVAHYFSTSSKNVVLWDARELIKTDDNFREGLVNWKKTIINIQSAIAKIDTENFPIIISQGFIGSTIDNQTTTLGREGSDYSAAIFANILSADSITIWKDVSGMLNADPKYFSAAVRLDKISYQEAIELAYYGATIIHPKTLKPLQSKAIPLYVKSFLNPLDVGSVIQGDTANDTLLPSYIFKINQILLSIKPRDFSFIVEENLSHIFSLFADSKVKMNIMQNSALNFSVCADMDDLRIPKLIEVLKAEYEVYYNENCELLTVRHYNDEILKELSAGKETLLTQISRSTARLVMR
jgi:aspartate kinase